MRVDEDPPGHARARRGQANLRVRVRPIHRHGDAVHALALRRGEDRSGNGAFGVVPLGLSHRPVGVAPFDVRELARVERGPGKESIARQRGIGAASGNQARREGDQGSVRGAPVDGARRVVLRVSVVVAALAEAQLRAHAEHWRSARGEQEREQIALVARARLGDRRIVARPLDAVVPAVVVVRAVAIVLAIGLVVLVLVRHKVAKREAIVDDDEIDARGRRSGAGKHVARTRHPGCDLATHSGVAAPETARGVAEAVVPVGERGGELAKAVAPWAHVPRLGDEARLGENGISGERLKERRLGIETRVAPAECGGEVEAKPVKTAIDHPALERSDRHLNHQRAIER